MKMRLTVTFLLLLVWFGTVDAHVYWDDGAYHLVNYDVGDWLIIDGYSSSFPGTHVEVVEGGKLPLVGLGHYGELTVNGGIVNYVSATQNSQVVINNGFITLNGQYTNPGFIINDDSQVDIYGGLFESVEGGPSFKSIDSSKLNIWGGDFGLSIDFCAQNNSQITIYGTDFNYPYGKIVVPDGNTNLDITITGTLLDGNTINHSFRLDGLGSSVVLVPEPMSFALLGLGGVAMFRKRKT